MHSEIQQMDDRSEIKWPYITKVLKFLTGRQKYFFGGKSEKIKVLQSELEKARKMESAGMLAGSIAHDFNNIMTAILGFSDLILMEARVDDATKEYIHEIQKSGRRAASLTRQLLAFSKKVILEHEIVDLNSLVTDTKGMLKVLLPENIELNTNLSQSLNKIKVDPDQIVQILTNLVINARDSMPDGGQIVIETENRYMDKFSCEFHSEIVQGSYVTLIVSDTGCGMDSKTKARVFEPFFTTKETGKGTGLGLASVYGIVKQSGGYIYSYSELNYGSSFKIYLPGMPEEDNPGKEVNVKGLTLYGKGRIIFVEDDESLRKIISRTLRGLGYNVYSASSGEDALCIYDKYRNTGIDLLISDIIMPGMKGRELAEKFLEENPDMKVLYISGYTNTIMAYHGIRNEDVSFLAKPFSIYDLELKIRKILYKHNTDKIGI